MITIPFQRFHVGVDPGVRGCGLSCWFDRQLLQAVYVKNPVLKGDEMHALLGMGRAVANVVDAVFTNAIPRHLNHPIVVVEFPQVYRGAQAKGDPRDLLALAAVDGAVVGILQQMFGEVESHRIFPREWKGQVDPDECVRRVQAKLTPKETALVELPCASLAHNTWDAIGIGLFAAGRFEAKHVFSRGLVKDAELARGGS